MNNIKSTTLDSINDLFNINIENKLFKKLISFLNNLNNDFFSNNEFLDFRKQY
jgi:hypothetical protein